MEIAEKLQEYQSRRDELQEQAADICQQIKGLSASVFEIVKPYQVQAEDLQRLPLGSRLEAYNDLADACHWFEYTSSREYDFYASLTKRAVEPRPRIALVLRSDELAQQYHFDARSQSPRGQARNESFRSISSNHQLGSNPSWEQFSRFQQQVNEYETILHVVSTDIQRWYDTTLPHLEHYRQTIASRIEQLSDISEDAHEE